MHVHVNLALGPGADRADIGRRTPGGVPLVAALGLVEGRNRHEPVSLQPKVMGARSSDEQPPWCRRQAGRLPPRHGRDRCPGVPLGAPPKLSALDQRPPAIGAVRERPHLWAGQVIDTDGALAVEEVQALIRGRKDCSLAVYAHRRVLSLASIPPASWYGDGCSDRSAGAPDLRHPPREPWGRGVSP